MDCRQMIEQYLKDNNYDGLLNCAGECACNINDIAQCGELNIDDCVPGYIQDFKRDGHDYVIGHDKPDGTKKPCSECGEAREVHISGVFSGKCPHCGDEVPF